MARISGKGLATPSPLIIHSVETRVSGPRLIVTLACEAAHNAYQTAGAPYTGCVICIPSLPPGEFAVAADMCEEYGLAEVAKMLRACEGVQEKGSEVEVTSRADTHRQYLQEDGSIRTGEEME